MSDADGVIVLFDPDHKSYPESRDKTLAEMVPGSYMCARDETETGTVGSAHHTVQVSSVIPISRQEVPLIRQLLDLIRGQQEGPNMSDPKITHDEELALHLYLQQAEDLARLIRIVSGGHLTLTIAENRRRPKSALDAAGVVGLGGMEAHDYASRLGGHSVNQDEFTAKLMALRSAEADTADRFSAAWDEVRDHG